MEYLGHRGKAVRIFVELDHEAVQVLLCSIGQL